MSQYLAQENATAPSSPAAGYSTIYPKADGKWYSKDDAGTETLLSVGTHALLDGSIHTDTVAQTVSRGSLIYGDATPKWNELVIGAANRVLRSDGTDVAWGQVALTTDVSGVLPIANGGTNGATALAAFNNLSPLTTRGDLLTRDATNNVRLAVGAVNSVLTANGTDPSWSATPTLTSLTTTGNIAVNGGALTTTAATFSLINANATTINFAGAATTINLGAASAVVNGAGGLTINGGIAANDDITIQGTSHSTRTTSYVLLQPNGGNVGIGMTGPNRKTEIYQADSNNSLLRLSSKTTVAGTSYQSGIEFYSSTTADNSNVFSAGRIYGVFDGTTYASNRLTLQTASADNTWTDTLSLKAGNVGIATTGPTGKLDILGTLTVASAASAVLRDFWMEPATITITGSTNITTAAGFNFCELGQPTYSAGSALTITSAATLYVANAPAGGGAGPATITNPYALWIDAGLSRFDGNGVNVFELPADATGNATAAVGRIPILVGGATKYVRYYND